MFVQDSKKVFANVCCQQFVVGWVKPYNIAFSTFPNVFNIFYIFFFLAFLLVSQNISFVDDNCVKVFSMDR